MVFNFLNKKNEDFPEFWKAYLDAFNEKNKLPLQNTRFIVLDTETTGFEKKKDRILSIGAVSLTNNKINVSDNFEVYLEQDIFKPETVKIHGLMKAGKLEKTTEIEAIEQFTDYIKNDILVAHHAGFDIGFINEMLLRHNLGKLKNKVLDTGTLYKSSKHLVYQDNLKHYSLDDLCEELKVQKVDRHTASGDALITAIVFQKIVSRLNKKNDLTVKKLLKL